MFTETELREALEHSAARVDETTVLAPPRRRWTRVALPLAAAASVAALAAGVVVATSGADGTRRGPSAATQSVPDTSSRPVATNGVVDFVAVGDTAGTVTYELVDLQQRGSAAAIVSHPLGGGLTVTVTAVPGSIVSDARAEQGRKVPIAGSSGWYAARRIYPLDAGSSDGYDKEPPRWTVAFRAPGGWAFATIDRAVAGDDSGLGADGVSLDNPARIAREVERLDLRWGTGAVRQALRVTSLPSGMQLTWAELALRDGKVTRETLRFDTIGRAVLEITLGAAPIRRQPGVCEQLVIRNHDGSVRPTNPSRCVDAVSRSTTAGVVSIESSGVSAAARSKALAGVRATASPKDYVGLAAALSG